MVALGFYWKLKKKKNEIPLYLQFLKMNYWQFLIINVFFVFNLVTVLIKIKKFIRNLH
jgi:hypothetical protein